MTTVLTKPRSHPASQIPHRYRHDRRWRRTEAGAPWSEMERGVSERRGRLGPGAGRHQARCADQRASADQATMSAKSPDFEIVSSHFGSAALTSNHINRSVLRVKLGLN